MMKDDVYYYALLLEHGTIAQFCHWCESTNRNYRGELLLPWISAT